MIARIKLGKLARLVERGWRWWDDPRRQLQHPVIQNPNGNFFELRAHGNRLELVRLEQERVSPFFEP